MQRPKRTCPGFTLIELLVVIAIIAVLIALLLPAIQAAREAARRAQCMNNLMQLSIAVQNYESANEVLPPGVINPTGPIRSTAQGYHVGWLVQLLPFLEQKNVYNHLNFSVGVYNASNSTVRMVAISSFLCPSDARGGRFGGSVGGVAGNNYAGCHHDVEAPIAANNQGVFFLNSAIRYEDIPDGSAQTIFVGEKPITNDLGWASGTRATLRNTGSTPNSKIGPNANLALVEDEAEAGQDPGQGTPAAAGSNLALAVGGFGSAHPGGSNFAFGDGGVRFLKNSINPAVYRLLGNRRDGEMISNDSY